MYTGSLIAASAACLFNCRTFARISVESQGIGQDLEKPIHWDRNMRRVSVVTSPMYIVLQSHPCIKSNPSIHLKPLQLAHEAQININPLTRCSRHLIYHCTQLALRELTRPRPGSPWVK